MDEIFRQAIIALRGMWRYRWLGLASAWVIGILGIAAIMLIPNKYEASARMFVNTDSILRPLMAGMTVAPDMNQRIEILSRILVSRPNVERLVRMSSLDPKEDLEKRADELIRDIQIKGTGRDQIYTITLRDRDAERAKRLVDDFTKLFFQSGQGNRDLDTDAAKKFVDQQIVVYEKRLTEAEERLKNFKQRSLAMLPGQGSDYFARLTEARNLSNRAQLDLREAEQSRDALKRGLTELDTGDGTSSAIGPDPKAKAAIESRIESMKQGLSVLLLKYTDTHPDVVGMRRAIEELEAENEKLPAVRRKDSASPSLASSQLNVSVAQAEANVASLRARVAEYAARENKLKESAMLIPQLETEFAQLNRDYDVNKKNYESLIARRESVALSGNMQEASGVGDFRLIDPPRVAPIPVFPNRPLLLVFALVFALGAGAATAYGAMTLHPAFYDGRALREATQLPVLGTIMKAGGGAMTPGRKKRVVLFLAGAGGLVAVYAGVTAVALLGLGPLK
ncbi:MAG: chain length-determining protein [Betaproteobacteria bacterium]|nr:chain length-determining protein [Betaproteobacteria bacterium]